MSLLPLHRLGPIVRMKEDGTLTAFLRYRRMRLICHLKAPVVAVIVAAVVVVGVVVGIVVVLVAVAVAMLVVVGVVVLVIMVVVVATIDERGLGGMIVEG